VILTGECNIAAAYGLGLLVTFAALAIMGTGQPALLYIVPLTLGTAVIVGWQRKELRQLWTGEPVSDDWLSVFTSCFAQLRDFPRIAVFLYDH